MDRIQSKKLFHEAKTIFPGGVNSPVRAFKSIGTHPSFIQKGDGAYMWDEDNNRYIDFCCSWGALILGHNHPKIRENIIHKISLGTSFGTPTQIENELGSLILQNNRFVDKIRFVNSGTEATMSAIRLARGYTKKNKIIKFEGCYHGHSDALLMQAGSGLVDLAITSSDGVPKSYANETIVLPLNDTQAVKTAFDKFGQDIAGIIIEPIPANNGLLLQDCTFLQYLRDICNKYASLLIFDEVISGFRVGFEGASGYYNIQPDIITYGKVIGGGLPVGAYASSNEIMSCISPVGNVYQAGTLSGNPIAMCAGYTQLSYCLEHNVYLSLEEKTSAFVQGINTVLDRDNIPYRMFNIGSIFWLSFSNKNNIKNSQDIDASSPSIFKTLYMFLLENGIYLGPSSYEVGFVSYAHTDKHLEEAKDKIIEGLRIIYNH